MIVLTTPNGLFTFDTHTNEVQHVLDGNFFGITIKDDTIIVSEKVYEDFYIRFLNFKFKDVIDKHKSNAEDIHQILYYNNRVFITNTGKDTVNCLDLNSNIEYSIIKIVKSEDFTFGDNYHINALCVMNNILFIGLNKNILDKNSSIVKVNLKDIDYKNIIYIGGTEKLKNIIHSHDICEYNDDLLISASQDGYIYSYNKKKPLFYTSNSWTRGLVVNDMGVWVGYSAVTVRKNRKRDFVCSINRFEHDTFKLLGSVKIKSGQICDMMYIPKDKFMQNITER